MKIHHSIFDFHGAFRPPIPRRLAAQGPVGEGGVGGACQALPRQSWGGEQTYRRARAWSSRSTRMYLARSGWTRSTSLKTCWAMWR